MLVTHKTSLPSFAVGDYPDQTPLYVYTILSINKSVGDCAAYRGIAPYMPDSDEFLDRIKSGGQKIREAEAREYFDEIENMGLRYRK